MARMTLEEIRNRVSTVDREKIEATTEAEIEAHRAADGDSDLDATAGARTVESPRSLRVRLGMTQPEMAAALNIPLGTWRNWEQGRVNLEPAAVALLRIISHNPGTALDALRRPAEPVRPDAEGVVIADLVAPEAPDVVSVSGGWLEVFERITSANQGRDYGTFDTPRTRQFTKLLHDPEVRAWLSERERSRAQSFEG